MPYTLVHPVVTIPVWSATGRRLRLAALAIGALTPDYQYFLTMNTLGGYMHSPAGLLFACLPTGWLTLWLWDRYGQLGLSAFLPAPWRRSAPATQPYHALAISLAILAGAVTHVAWDSFTHASGAVVALFPVLSQTVQVGPIAYPIYRFLQHGSTLAGGGVLALLAVRWFLAQPAVPLKAVVGRLAVAGLFLGCVAFLNALRFWSHGIERILVTSGVAVTLGVGLGPILLGVAVRRPAATVG